MAVQECPNPDMYTYPENQKHTIIHKCVSHWLKHHWQHNTQNKLFLLLKCLLLLLPVHFTPPNDGCMGRYIIYLLNIVSTTFQIKLQFSELKNIRSCLVLMHW